MKTSLKSATINWLVSQPAQATILNDNLPGCSRTKVPMPAEMGHGWFEIIPLSIGIYLTQVFYHFTEQMYGQSIPFHHMQGDLHEPTLIISAVQSGRLSHKDLCVGGEYTFGVGQALFKLVDRIDHQPTFDASSDIEVTVLGVGLTALRTFLGSEHADSMLESLRLSSCPSAAVHVMPKSASKLLFTALQNHLAGSMRTLFAQAKVLEYICELSQSLSHITERNEQRLITINEELITHLYNDLALLEGKVPTLEELARNYGASARILNDEFKKKYGSSIYNYITELRLNAAHDTLLTTTVPMKVIAANLGYSHVNHFITAFRKKFGCSPGSLRRQAV